MNNQNQPVRRPIRHNIDMHVKRQPFKGGRWAFGNIPRSIVINFVIMLAVIGAVFALQSIGHKGKTADEGALKQAVQATAETENAAPEIVKSAPVKLENKMQPVISEAFAATTPPVASAPATAPIPTAATAPSADNKEITAPAQPASEKPKAAPSEVKPSVYTLDQSAGAEPGPEKPVLDKKQTLLARKKAVVDRKIAASKDEHAADRTYSLYELDNESARQGYLNDTRKLGSDARRAEAVENRPRPLPQAAPSAPSHAYSDIDADLPASGKRSGAKKAAPRSQGDYAGSSRVSPVDDLDGEAARQHYLAETSRRLGLSNEKSKKSPPAAVPAPGGEAATNEGSR